MSGQIAKRAGIVALAAWLAVLTGCEDDVLQTAPAESSLVLTANPGVVIIRPDAPRDPETNQQFGTSSITVLALDENGFPLEGISVFLSTTAGQLGSQPYPPTPGAPAGQPLETDVNGYALDVLRLLESDPPTVTVTARSAGITADVTISKQIGECTNIPPEADAGDDQTVELDDEEIIVILDGRGSTDAETAVASLRYEWDCGNGRDADEVPAQASLFPQVVQCVYDIPDEYTVTLTVTDRGSGEPDPNNPGRFLCELSDSSTATITVDIPARR
jgi:hypothetical protein